MKMLDVKKLWELEKGIEALMQERKYLMKDSKKYEWYSKEIAILEKDINNLYNENNKFYR